ncbi:fumarylacetoacetase [Bradyrhizobium sp. 14AA]
MHLDETHDAAQTSWVTSANGHPDFPIQNLPIGIFSPRGGGNRPGIAIGDFILDLAALGSTGLLTDGAKLAAAFEKNLNGFLALGSSARRALRTRLFELLRDGFSERARIEAHLHEAASCTLHMPAVVGDYTDFYVGIHHATNIGKQLRPDNPLLPNYKFIPIGYHGRTSSIRPSGTPVRRPTGQIKIPGAEIPAFKLSRRLDYELELGVWIGPGNQLGEPIPIEQAAEHIAGYCILNDWSARDIQAWEYQPLGPFLAKNFGTTISPWIVTPEALAPFRIPQPKRPAGDPPPLPYLFDATDQREGALNAELEVLLLTSKMREAGIPPHRLSLSNARHMYWTPAQMVTHHASGGCNLQPGDFLGTGTISAPDAAGCGSIMETTKGGTEPVHLASGEERRFLEDGDEIIMAARCRREGFASIGFGTCRAEILPAHGS